VRMIEPARVRGVTRARRPAGAGCPAGARRPARAHCLTRLSWLLLLLALPWTVRPVAAQDAAAATRDTAAVREARPRDAAALSREMTRRYPPTFEALGIAGVVRLMAFVTVAGKADSVHVTSSSGVSFLDNTATSVVRGAGFIAARSADGPVGSWLELELAFGDGVAWAAADAPGLADRPQLLERIQAHVPTDLRRQGVEESVVVVLSVDREGRVTDVRTPGPGCFPTALEAGLQAARELSFEPARDGAAAVRTSIATFSFAVDSVHVRLLGDSDPSPKPRARNDDATPRSGETRAPRLLNPDGVSRALTRHYPASLYRAGIRPELRVWLFIDERGRVVRRRLSEPSGNCELDRGALEVARTMRFSPALRDGKPVEVWVEIPVQFGGR
jgi:TonB family protein